MLADEIVHQLRQILRASPQRRQLDGHRVDTVQKIQTERAVCHLLAKVAVRHRYNPGLDRASFVSAHPHVRAVLQNLQQLRLNANIQAADLIQE